MAGLQAKLGNHAVGRLLMSGHLLPKLSTDSPDGRHQQESATTSDQGMGMANSALQLQPEEDKEYPPVQMKALAKVIQCELRRQPPGREKDPKPLSAGDVQDAMTYNNDMFSEEQTRIIQDIVGATQTGEFDEKTIQMIVEWQADFRMSTIDGKVGFRTLRPIILEMMRSGYSEDTILWMIVDGHNMPTRGLLTLTYNPALADTGLTTGPIPGDSNVEIGPSAFDLGYAGLVHSIRHELEHVRQARDGMANLDLQEFLAEGIEIMSKGMHWEDIEGFMIDASRCVNFWTALSRNDKRAYWDRFVEIRERVRQRFDNASDDYQTLFQPVMDDFNNQNPP